MGPLWAFLPKLLPVAALSAERWGLGCSWPAKLSVLAAEVPGAVADSASFSTGHSSGGGGAPYPGAEGGAQ